MNSNPINKVKIQSSTIRQLGKIQPSNIVSPENNISTINFGNSSLDQSDNQLLKNIYENYHPYLLALYRYAKELKIDKNIDIALDASNRGGFNTWLGSQEVAIPPIGSNDFEIIGAKVVEAIDSIKANPYIRGLELKVKTLCYQKQLGLDPKEFKSLLKTDKTLKKNIEKSNPSIQQIQNIDKEEFFDCVNYSVIIQARNLVVLINQAEIFSQVNSDTKKELVNKLEEFLKVSVNDFSTYLLEAKHYIKDNEGGIKNPTQTLINKFFFSFADKFQVVENEYFGDINEMLNSLTQGLGENLSKLFIKNQKEDEQIKLRDRVTKAIIVLNQLDYTELDIIKLEKNLDTIYNKINQTETDENFFDSNSRGDYLKGVTNVLVNQYKSLFFRHPKNAPSYPNPSNKHNNWRDDDTMSQWLGHRQDIWENRLFVEFGLSRLCRIVASSEFYKTLKLLDGVINLGDSTLDIKTKDTSYLYNIVEQSLLNTAITLPNLNPTKGHNNNTPTDQRLKNAGISISEKKFDSSKKRGKINIQQYKFVYADSQETKFETINIIRNSKISTIEEYYNNQFALILINNPEIQTLKDNVIWDKIWLKKWFDAKYIKNPTNQSLEIYNNCPHPTVNKEIIKNLVNQYNDLEIFLKLNQNNTNYQLPNNADDQTRATFKQYQNLVQLGLESCSVERDVKRDYKAKLAKLQAENVQTLPFKINRMTNRTNGDTSLVFELDTTKNQVNYKQGYILSRPIKTGALNGQEIKIIANRDKANQLWQSDQSSSQPKYSKICVGFLNGSNDNTAPKIINYAKDTEGQILRADKQPTDEEKSKLIERGVVLLPGGLIPKYYSTYGQWTLSNPDTSPVISIVDPYRPSGQSAGGIGAPAGYPQLYYFLIPINSTSLFCPVKTSLYYLNKYTVYGHINQYLKFDKEKKYSELLEYRCKLRNLAGLSSAEVGIIKKQSGYQLEAHIQVNIPLKQTPKIGCNLEQFSSRYKSILSLDLGEKHLATANLYRLNINEDGFISVDSDSSKTFYLPLLNGEFNQLLAEYNNWEKADKLEIKFDTFTNKYANIKIKYKNQQRAMGVVSEGMRNRKANFVDGFVEQIANQVTKLVTKYDAYLVMESLESNLSSRKLELNNLKDTQKAILSKMIKTGLVANSQYIGDDIVKVGSGAYINKETKLREHNLVGISRVSPWMTSQECSECGYIPLIAKEPKSTDKVAALQKIDKSEYRVKAINLNSWCKDGYIEIYFGYESEPFIRLEDNKGELVQAKGYCNLGQEIKLKNNYNFEKSTLKIQLESRLYKNRTRIEPNKILLDSLKLLIKTRHVQENFACPRCGHKDNADYNAAKVIGKRLIQGLQ